MDGVLWHDELLLASLQAEGDPGFGPVLCGEKERERDRERERERAPIPQTTRKDPLYARHNKEVAGSKMLLSDLDEITWLCQPSPS